MKSCSITGAYGRRYKSGKAMESDFHANKDFVLHDITSPYDGKYCNKTDLIRGGYTSIEMRFNNRMDVRVVKLG